MKLAGGVSKERASSIDIESCLFSISCRPVRKNTETSDGVPFLPGGKICLLDLLQISQARLLHRNATYIKG
jgi:hypothetical protein